MLVNKAFIESVIEFRTDDKVDSDHMLLKIEEDTKQQFMKKIEIGGTGTREMEKGNMLGQGCHKKISRKWKQY